MVDVIHWVRNELVMVHAFGALIILLYAKDKFNMPTYNRDAMGPFAQLPPQFLTMDTRYRWGRTVYIGLMLALYAAICVIGPAAFNFEGVAQSIAPSIPGGTSSAVWPVAAAAFLISTGAASDNNILGKIELLIRQYAHKSAYIPSAVSDLAFTLRTVNIHQWLIENPYVGDFEMRERQRALVTLVGQDGIEKIKQQPDQEGQLAAWVRANILFYTLQQIFSKRPGVSTTKLDYLTDLPENRQIFDSLRSTRDALMQGLENAKGSSDDDPGKLFADIQRFSKDTSLTIAVLLSQTARNANYLTDRLDQLGFQGVDLRDRSDHFTYTIMVNSFILVGSLVVAIVLAVGWLSDLDMLSWIHNVSLTLGAITIFSGTLVYVVLFKSMDYWREKLLDTLDWHENLQSYVRLTLSASFLSCIVTVVLLVLTLFALDLTEWIINGPVAFITLFASNFVVSALGIAFGLVYLRQAARLPKPLPSLPKSFLNFTALTHAVVAAVFVGVLNLSVYLYNVTDAPKTIAGRLQEIWRTASKDPKLGFFDTYPNSQLAAIGKKLDDLSANLRQIEIGAVASQMAALQDVCNRASKPDVTAAPQNPSKPSQELSDNATNSPLSTTALFKDNVPCVVADLPANDSRVEIGRLLSTLQDSLVAAANAKKQLLFVWAFPATAAFLIAYAFGVGCRYWRMWWLHSEEDNLKDFKAEIRARYGPDIDVEKCLVWPLSLLGGVTPIEAVRYEDYRSKLFANVQKHKIEWPRSFYGAATRDKGSAAAAAASPAPSLAGS